MPPEVRQRAQLLGESSRRTQVPTTRSTSSLEEAKASALKPIETEKAQNKAHQFEPFVPIENAHMLNMISEKW